MNKKTVTMATATIAAMLAGVMLTGCQNTPAAGDTTGGDTASGNTMASDPAAAQTTTAAQTTPARSAGELGKASGSGGTCNQWPGVGTLQGATIPLRLAASNTESNGYQDPSDGMAVNIALTAVANELYQLPADWAQAIQNQVIFPGHSADPSQMYTAASNAQSLASQISQLCYTP